MVEAWMDDGGYSRMIRYTHDGEREREREHGFPSAKLSTLTISRLEDL